MHRSQLPTALLLSALTHFACADNLPSPCDAGEPGDGTNCLYLVTSANTYDSQTGNRMATSDSLTVDIEVWMDFDIVATQGGGFDIVYDPALVANANWSWDPQMISFNAITLSGAPGSTGWEGIQFDDFAGNGFGGTTGTRPGFLRLGTLTVTFNQGSMTTIGLAQPYTDATFPNCFAPGAFSGASGCLPTQFYALEITASAPLDSDGDGVFDSVDNCIQRANADQRDTNADGFGNICDADFNNDCTVNFVDLQIIKGTIFGSDPDTDMDNNGSVNFGDLSLVRSDFFGEPGPSAIATCP